MDINFKSVESYWQDVIKTAKQSIVVFAPFWDDFLLDLLTHSPISDITIITSSDTSKYVTSPRAYTALQRAMKKNMLVKELDNLHAKLLIVDDHLVSIGSQNFTTNSHNIMLESTLCLPSNGHQQSLPDNWEKNAKKLTSQRQSEIEAAVNKYSGLKILLSKMRKDFELSDLKTYPVKYVEGRIEPTNGLTFEEVFIAHGHSVNRSEWVPVFFQKKNWRLLFARVNKRTVSLTFKDYEINNQIVKIDNSKLSYEVGYQVKALTKKDANLVINAKITYLNRIYRAKVYYSVLFDNGRQPEILWTGRQPPQELRNSFSDSEKIDDLLDLATGKFRIGNFLKHPGTKPIGEHFSKVERVQVISISDNPALIFN